MSDYDAREFQSSNYIKKDELKRDGEKRLTVRAVEQADGIARNGKPAKKILELLIDDDRRLSLGTMANLKRMIEWFGVHTSAWVGQVIVAYYSPDVRGPNGEEGGIRLRRPGAPGPVTPSRSFAADLKTEPAVSAATAAFVEGLNDQVL